MNFLLLIAGIAVLIVGAEIFVNSSVSIAKKLKIPTVIIALTIIAIGTSAPETVISITASATGHSDLSMSNIIGSNFFNLMFIIGFCALIKPINVKLKEVGPEAWLMVGSTAVLFLVMIAASASGGANVPRVAGVVMAAAFIVYLSLLLRHALQGNRSHDHVTHRTSVEVPHEKTKPIWLAVIGVVFGLAIIIAGGELTVSRAEMIAEQLSVPPRTIGLTIIGAGTSLPELIIALIACKKRESGMALGTVIGTNIYNLLFILGIAGTVDPFVVNRNQLFDLGALTIGNVMVLIYILTRKKITRIEGASMVALYLGYMAYIVLSS
jgi:cation:H+ antiporter